MIWKVIQGKKLKWLWGSAWHDSTFPRIFIPWMLSVLCIFLDFIIVLGESVNLYKLLYHGFEISFQLSQNLILYWKFIKSRQQRLLWYNIFCTVCKLRFGCSEFFSCKRTKFSLSHWMCTYPLLSCHWIFQVTILFIPSASEFFLRLIPTMLKICSYLYHKIYICNEKCTLVYLVYWLKYLL